MKKLLFMSAICMSVFIVACKKSDNNKPTTTAKFTFDNTNYVTAKVEFAASGGLAAFADSAVSTDKSKAVIVDLIFKGNSRPATGNYTLVSGANSPAAGQVVILLGYVDLKNTQNTGLYASGDGGGTVVITNTNGKLTASVPAATVAGNYFDNTDPSNTKITNVSANLSAVTFSE